jgi:hypothetical protein
MAYWILLQALNKQKQQRASEKAQAIFWPPSPPAEKATTSQDQAGADRHRRWGRGRGQQV